jgi:5-methylcytosine-specific restriction endonuclease McrA
MGRRSFSQKDRARIFAANNGVCHLCNGAITVGDAWEIEHVIAWELTRDDSDENLRPAHIKCHKIKTHTEDRPAINKAKRREAAHLGVKRPKKKLQGRGFAKTDKPKRVEKSPLPPLQLYTRMR